MSKASFLMRMLLADFLNAYQAGPSPPSTWRPLVDVLASTDVARVRFELAGMSPEALEISVEGQMLRVRGQRPLPELSDKRAGFGYRRAEIQYGTFERVVELPWRADPSRLRALYQNGLLLVEIESLPTPESGELCFEGSERGPHRDS
jgi:HSP20 family protein